MRIPGLLFLGTMMMASLAASGRSADSVPPILTGGFHSFETPRPASADDWERQRAELRKKLWRLLGELPPLCPPKVTIQKKEHCDGYTREHLTFQNGIGDTVYGYLLVPAGHQGRGPAILYNHYHGGQYAQGKEELFLPSRKWETKPW